jgi:tRNA A-37 threonylcarbamoyl transferase component Bud32
MEAQLGLPKDTLLDGSYRIIRVIGSGGFGITYECEDLNLGSKVAIKEYYPAEFAGRDAAMSVRARSERHKEVFAWGRERFLHEARTLARFRHPSIVHVTRVFEANATAYMVMAFESGPPLDTWLKRLERPPTQDELDRLLAPLLDAVELIHAADFVHRDIAPDNIIVRADGVPVLLDFGAARRILDERSRAFTGIVKAGYSPPEQYSCDRRLQGPWSDVYALGATLYRAVTGKPPEESSLRVAEDRMPPATLAACAAYRRDFLQAIDACLKVMPKARPQSIARLRAMLLPEEAPPAATRLLPRKTRPLPLTSRQWLAVAAAFAAVVGVYGGSMYARLAGERQEAIKGQPALEERLLEQARIDEERARREAEERRAGEAKEAERAYRAEQKKREAEDAERRRELFEREARAEEERRKAMPRFGGSSWNYPTKAQAEARALLHCTGGCKVAVWFKYACGAIAFAAEGAWGSGWGTSHAIAERSAIASCQQHSPSCRVDRWVCSPSGFGAIAVAAGG